MINLPYAALGRDVATPPMPRGINGDGAADHLDSTALSTKPDSPEWTARGCPGGRSNTDEHSHSFQRFTRYALIPDRM